MKQIVLATNNPGKGREFTALLADLAIEVLPQSAFAVPEIEETGLTFVENAILKARNAALYTALPVIADDSGLVVDALHGAPGVYSARYAGPNAHDKENLEKLLANLHAIPDAERSARFHCVLVYMRYAEDPVPLICQGSWEGMITQAPQGENGFGYDPIFWVPTHDKTAAELPLAVKNRLSHRGQALQQLLANLKQQASLNSHP